MITKSISEIKKIKEEYSPEQLDEMKVVLHDLSTFKKSRVASVEILKGEFNISTKQAARIWFAYQLYII